MAKLVNDFFAEFLGTLFFIYFILLSSGNAFIIGISLAAIVYFTAHISGGHINPAVTAAMIALGKINTTQAIVYILAQLLGAMTAVIVYKKLKV